MSDDNVSAALRECFELERAGLILRRVMEREHRKEVPAGSFDAAVAIAMDQFSVSRDDVYSLVLHGI